MKRLLFIFFLSGLAFSQYTWTSVTPGGITLPAIGPTWGYLDKPNHKIVFYPGWCDDPILRNKLYQYDYIDSTLDTVPNIGTTEPPAPLNFYVSYYDTISQSFFIWGGSDGTAYYDDMWLYSRRDSMWQNITFPYGHPTARGQAGWVFDPVHYRMVLWGGYSGGGHSFHDDLWAFDIKQLAWYPLEQYGDIPDPYCGYAVARVGRYLIMFGGIYYDIGFSNELHALNLDTYVWTSPPDWGDIPSTRRHARFAIDHHDSTLYLFGGDRSVGGGAFLNDLYKLDLATWEWTEIHPGGWVCPSPRNITAFVKIPTAPAIIEIGGVVNYWTYTNTCYYLNWIDTTYDAVSERYRNIASPIAYTVFPNPTFSSFIVDLPSAVKATVRVCDVQGREVLSQKASGRTTIALAARGVPPGVYIVKLHSEKVSLSTNREVLYIR